MRSTALVGSLYSAVFVENARMRKVLYIAIKKCAK